MKKNRKVIVREVITGDDIEKGEEKILNGLQRASEKVTNESDYICPYCQKQAGLYYSGAFKVRQFKLDPMLNNIGECQNPECLNSEDYKEIKEFYEKHGRKEFGMVIVQSTDNCFFDLLKLGRKIARKRYKKLGLKETVLACPQCRQWTLDVIEDSAPGCLALECKNPKCKKELLVNRT